MPAKKNQKKPLSQINQNKPFFGPNSPTPAEMQAAHDIIVKHGMYDLEHKKPYLADITEEVTLSTEQKAKIEKVLSREFKKAAKVLLVEQGLSKREADKVLKAVWGMRLEGETPIQYAISAMTCKRKI